MLAKQQTSLKILIIGEPTVSFTRARKQREITNPKKHYYGKPSALNSIKMRLMLELFIRFLKDRDNGHSPLFKG